MSMLDVSSNISYGTLDSEQPMDSREDERLLYSHSAYEVDNDVGTEGGDTSSDGDVQEGVRKIEAISHTWTQRSLIIAYLGLVGNLA